MLMLGYVTARSTRKAACTSSLCFLITALLVMMKMQGGGV